MCYEGDGVAALEHFKKSVSETQANYYRTADFTLVRFNKLKAFIRRSKTAFEVIAKLQVTDTSTSPALKSFQILANDIVELGGCPYTNFHFRIEHAFAEVRSRMKFTYAKKVKGFDESSSDESSAGDSGFLKGLNLLF